MKTITGTAVAALLSLAVGTATASENSGSGYPNGAEGFLAGAVPPPGTYLLLYGSHYTADTLKSDAGDIDIDLDATALVPRLVHVTPIKILGADWGMHAILPLVHLELEVPALGTNETRNGIGDLTLDPIILSWHRPNLHYAVGIDVVVPIGQYDDTNPVTRLTSIGRNYWTVEPLFGISWISEGGLELSGKFMFDINFENPDTNYRTGNEFHADYTVGQHIGDWTLGVGGYFYKQVEDDEAPAGVVATGRGQAFAVGPQVKFNWQGMSFIAKWQHEEFVENRTEGDKFWLKFITPL